MQQINLSIFKTALNFFCLICVVVVLSIGCNPIGDECEYYGWYGDGVCDTFCPKPDPDCKITTTTTDSGDICEDGGYYGDGVCDDWCPKPDPDCYDWCDEDGLYDDTTCTPECPLPDPGCDQTTTSSSSSSSTVPDIDECEENDLYGDGKCDDWCPKPDPDCEGCPDDFEPAINNESVCCPLGQSYTDDDGNCTEDQLETLSIYDKNSYMEAIIDKNGMISTAIADAPSPTDEGPLALVDLWSATGFSGSLFGSYYPIENNIIVTQTVFDPASENGIVIMMFKTIYENGESDADLYIWNAKGNVEDGWETDLPDNVYPVHVEHYDNNDPLYIELFAKIKAEHGAQPRDNTLQSIGDFNTTSPQARHKMLKHRLANSLLSKKSNQAAGQDCMQDPECSVMITRQKKIVNDYVGLFTHNLEERLEDMRLRFREIPDELELEVREWTFRSTKRIYEEAEQNYLSSPNRPVSQDSIPEPLFQIFPDHLPVNSYLDLVANNTSSKESVLPTYNEQYWNVAAKYGRDGPGYFINQPLPFDFILRMPRYPRPIYIGEPLNIRIYGDIIDTRTGEQISPSIIEKFYIKWFFVGPGDVFIYDSNKLLTTVIFDKTGLFRAHLMVIINGIEHRGVIDFNIVDANETNMCPEFSKADLVGVKGGPVSGKTVTFILVNQMMNTEAKVCYSIWDGHKRRLYIRTRIMSPNSEFPVTFTIPNDQTKAYLTLTATDFKILCQCLKPPSPTELGIP